MKCLISFELSYLCVQDMNIPPLISRTPPPINDVVDDEDEEEDDNDIAAFPSLDFCDPKISDKTSGTFMTFEL